MVEINEAGRRAVQEVAQIIVDGLNGNSLLRPWDMYYHVSDTGFIILEPVFKCAYGYAGNGQCKVGHSLFAISTGKAAKKK